MTRGPAQYPWAGSLLLGTHGPWAVSRPKSLCVGPDLGMAMHDRARPTFNHSFDETYCLLFSFSN